MSSQMSRSCIVNPQIEFAWSSRFYLSLLQFLKLLRPRHWRRETDVVRTGERANFRHVILRADVGACVPTTVCLLLRVERMQRSVKGAWVSHSSRLQNLRHVASNGLFQVACLDVEGFQFLVQRFELFLK